VTLLRVHGETIIERPLATVQAQFADMAHHAATGVHKALAVGNVRPQANGCRFTGRRRVLGLVQEDEMEVERLSDGGSVLRSLSGSNAGLVITQAFEALGPDRTRVRTTVELPVRGMRKLLAPLLRVALRQDLATALAEDKADLEVRGYPLIA